MTLDQTIKLDIENGLQHDVAANLFAAAEESVLRTFKSDIQKRFEYTDEYCHMINDLLIRLVKDASAGNRIVEGTEEAFTTLLCNLLGQDLWRQFCEEQKTGDQHGTAFWIEVRSFKASFELLSEEERACAARRAFRKFQLCLSNGSAQERLRPLENDVKEKTSHPALTIFDEPAQAVFSAMYVSSYPRFLTSPQHVQLVEFAELAVLEKERETKETMEAPPPIDSSKDDKGSPADCGPKMPLFLNDQMLEDPSQGISLQEMLEDKRDWYMMLCCWLLVLLAFLFGSFRALFSSFFSSSIHLHSVCRFSFCSSSLSPHFRYPLFLAFCQQEHSEESLMCLVEMKKYKLLPPSGYKAKAQRIVQEYLSSSSDMEVSLDGPIKAEIKARMEHNEFTADLFKEASVFLTQLVKNDSYHRFISSDLYHVMRERLREEKQHEPSPVACNCVVL